MKSCAAYLRVSTERQNEENQEPDVLRLIEARGWAAPVVYREVASGAKKRPELERLITDARGGLVGVVVVWALDRLGRNMWDVVDKVRELDRLCVKLVSVREPWFDTGGPVRDLLLAVFSWVAEQERTRLRERIKAALDSRKKQIETKGHYLNKEGVVRTRLGRPETVALSADAWITARKLRAEGKGWRAIASHLRRIGAGNFAPRTLERKCG